MCVKLDESKHYLESKWEYVNKVGKICKEKGLDDFMEQNKELDNTEFRDWLRNRLAEGFKTSKDPLEVANQILDFVVTSETIYTDKD